MILRALYDLAQSEELIADLDYEMKGVAWIVRVGPGGKLVGIEGTHELVKPTGKGKPKAIPRVYSIPRQPIGRSGTKAPASFLVDNAKYVFGLGTKGKELRPGEGQDKSGWFREQVEACARDTGDEGARAVVVFLQDICGPLGPPKLPEECVSNDLFAFSYLHDGPLLVHQRPKVREYWKHLRQASSAEGTQEVTCSVTGVRAHPARLFPLLKKPVPGGNTSGVALVSFNKSAFESHGWKGIENAPISREAAEACATALDRLLDPAPADPRPGHEGGRLQRRNVRISEDTTVCFWASSTGATAVVDAFPFLLLGEDPAVVGDLHRSVFRGREVKVSDPGRFCALTLSGSQARAVIRDWFVTSVGEVITNLSRHFADLALVGERSSGREGTPVPLGVMLRALAPPGKNVKVPPQLAAQIVGAALRGTAYPLSVLQRALERTRAEASGLGADGLDGWQARQRQEARCALIKGVLRRQQRPIGVTPSMDPGNMHPGYLLGRLMAVLERLQQAAMKNVNASVVDRYFGAASATPRTVFPRLLKQARHHARKALDDPESSGLARMLENAIDDIASRFGVPLQGAALAYSNPNRNGFPSHLDLTQQGLFVLGYHHQRHWLWMTKEARATWEADLALPNNS